MKGAYIDCFCFMMPCVISFEEFVTAFYTSRLFKIERVILSIVVRKPSDDRQAIAIAQGRQKYFSAWSERARSPNELLMCDFQNQTCSFFKVVEVPCSKSRESSENHYKDFSTNAPSSVLYFGTVLVPHKHSNGKLKEKPLFIRWLMPFHRLYSKALMRSAIKRLRLLRKNRTGES